MNIRRGIYYFNILIIAITFSACANYLRPFHTERARIGSPTAIGKELKQLPPSADKIVVATYRFRDETGQYKSTENGASWSTAVTQGATSILIQALEQSGWFVPIEREDLSNLLNERKVIQMVRAQYKGQDGKSLPPLPPLLYAGVLLEGGIISYDSNVLTGGMGARYLGIGASGQYRQDQVTIYLRATSTQSGKILKTVYTTKTILSEKVDAGVFRFVDTDKLLEGEAGYSFNEPTTLAVTEAIDKAVFSLIVEGIHEGIWNLKNPNDIHLPIFQNYENEKKNAAEYDSFGRYLKHERKGFGVGLNYAMQRYDGNYPNPLVKPDAEMNITWHPHPLWGIGLEAGLGYIGAKNVFRKEYSYGGLKGTYYVLPYYKNTLYLTASSGVLLGRTGFNDRDDLFPYISGGIGFEQYITPFMGLDFEFKNVYSLYDGLDGIKKGNINDMIWRGNIGLKFYLNRK